MTNLTRILSLSIPLLLSLASLTLLILILLGTRSPTTLPSLFFLSLDTSTFSLASYLPSPLAASYTIGLWNYCAYNTTIPTTSTPTSCSPPSPFYHFDPLTIWSIRNTTLEPLLPADWSGSLATYATVSKWLFIAYVAALAATAFTLLVGAVSGFMFVFFAGRWSRWGGRLTAIAATVAAVLTALASATATAVFMTLRGFVVQKLGGYGVKSGLGVGMFVLTWVAVACSAVAAGLWVGGMCCWRGDAAGERGRGVGAWGQERRRGVGAWGQQRGADYERVPSPFASPYADDDAAAATAGKSTRKVDVPLEQRWPSSGDGKDGVYEPYRENERV